MKKTVIKRRKRVPAANRDLVPAEVVSFVDPTCRGPERPEPLADPLLLSCALPFLFSPSRSMSRTTILLSRTQPRLSCRSLDLSRISTSSNFSNSSSSINNSSRSNSRTRPPRVNPPATKDLPSPRSHRIIVPTETVTEMETELPRRRSLLPKLARLGVARGSRPRWTTRISSTAVRTVQSARTLLPSRAWERTNEPQLPLEEQEDLDLDIHLRTVLELPSL